MDKNQIKKIARMLTEDPDIFSEAFEMPKMTSDTSTTAWLGAVGKWKELKAAVNAGSMTEPDAIEALEAFKKAKPPSKSFPSRLAHVPKPKRGAPTAEQGRRSKENDGHADAHAAFLRGEPKKQWHAAEPSKKQQEIQRVVEMFKNNPEKWVNTKTEFEDMANGGDGGGVRRDVYGGWSDNWFNIVIEKLGR